MESPDRKTGEHAEAAGSVDAVPRNRVIDIDHPLTPLGVVPCLRETNGSYSDLRVVDVLGRAADRRLVPSLGRKERERVCPRGIPKDGLRHVVREGSPAD